MGRARMLVVAVLLAAVAAVASVALTSGSPDVSSKDVGFSLLSDGRASVLRSVSATGAGKSRSPGTR